jgi:hypothetical protein
MKVRKADSSVERYMHTKVMHAISRALDSINKSELSAIESLAEVVTYFLYNRHKECNVQSSEILSAIKVSLAAVGYEQAAEAISSHHFQRQLKRNRTEVIDIDIHEISDLSTVFLFRDSYKKYQWDKSYIVDDLQVKHGMDHHTARTIAAMAEEKIFNMNITQVPKSLVKQIVLSDTAAVMSAQVHLQTA